ncbi:MAG TPA: hypothetical protein PKD64_13840 [Pirellulaceae bacterium]|nr:hypothetical protein [Pirellulaceae bacterium]HMO93268.1 hypothetical protein [Pirellulaceae bacterium]HMP70192.1 hypothetical protein [Pirellulaceae bacterium]
MSDNRSIDELVVVVHGVGDPAPGETLSLFARSVADQRQPLTEMQEVLWLEEEGTDPRFVSTFGSHVRHLRFSRGRVSLAEVFWGDLSEVKKGSIGAIFGLIEIVFGLRFLAFVAADQQGLPAKTLRALGMLISRIVHGPLLAVNLLLVVMAITAAFSELLWRGSTNDNEGARWLVVVSFSCSCMISLIARLATQSKVLKRFWFWLGVASLFLAGVWLAEILDYIETPDFITTSVLVADSESDLSPTTQVVGQQLNSQQQGLIFALASAYSGNPLALTNSLTFNSLPEFTDDSSASDENAETLIPVVPKSLYCHFYTHALVTVLGTMWLSLVVILIAMFACWFLAILSPNTCSQAANAALLLPAVCIGTWGVILPFAWILLSNLVSKVIIIKEFDLIFSDAIPLLGVQLLIGIVIGSVMLAVLIRYSLWRALNHVTDYERGRRAPRLIVNGAVQTFTMLGAMTGIVLVLFLAHMQVSDIPYQSHTFGKHLAAVNKYAVATLFPLALIVLISFKHLRPALDIVGDIVAHFQFRRITETECHDDEFEFGEIGFTNARYHFFRRESIHNRMKSILSHFRHATDGKPKLTIVAHSQGTLIAIEVLNDPELNWLSAEFSEINLLTMGSPFTHIYQHYFGHYYPHLDHPHWSNLRGRIAAWANIFRIDDFVGTEINFTPALEAAVNCSNHPIERKGHNNYWSDRQVLAIVHQLKFCRALLEEELGQEVGIQPTSEIKVAEQTRRNAIDRDHSRRSA